MPRMIAKKPLRYAHRTLRVGEAFDAAVADVRVLSVTGMAAILVDGLEGEPEVEAKIAARIRRRYKRRDMQAQA